MNNISSRTGNRESLQLLQCLLQQEKLSGSKQRELDLFLSKKENEAVIKNWITDYWLANRMKNDKSVAFDADEVYKDIFNRLTNKLPTKPAISKLWFLSNLGKKTVTTAALIVLSISLLWWFFSKPQKTVIVSNIGTVPKQYLPPAKLLAFIILENGKRLNINQQQKGFIYNTANYSVSQPEQGSIVYTQTSADYSNLNDKEVMNSLTVPQNSKQCKAMLADGTIVWVNTGSTLRFPALFHKKNRVIELKGEACFEVAHNAARPFYVKTNKLNVRVLGTKFNVKAYVNEPAQVTLLQGSVSIIDEKAQECRLIPGDKAVFSTNQVVISHQFVAKESIAWMEGKFEFGKSTDLQIAIAEIARWYGVTVDYKRMAPAQVAGTLSKNLSLDNLLNILDQTGSADIKLEENKIVVR